MKRELFEVPAGRMAYVDVGQGEQTVVLVHGNPSSAAEFASVIEALGAHYRCIAPEHIGFGQSDKPADWDYLPQNHAENLRALLDHLDIDRVLLVVGDWGGPIGLSWALDNPERVDGLLIHNTWMWSVEDEWYYRGFSWFAGGPVGRRLTERLNFFARSVVRQAWGSRRPLTAELHAQFLEVHKQRAERKGMWVFPREIIGSSQWLGQLWDRRAVLDQIPMHVQWGMEDVAFRKDVLAKWQASFPHATVERLDDVGHFVALEAPTAALAAIERLGEHSESE